MHPSHCFRLAQISTPKSEYKHIPRPKHFTSVIGCISMINFTPIDPPFCIYQLLPHQGLKHPPTLGYNRFLLLYFG
jgi:hypothetical protein